MYSHSTAQLNDPGTRPEYYTHQLRSFAMTDSTDTFLNGATAFKNAMDLTGELWNTAIVRTNEMASQTVEEKKEKRKRKMRRVRAMMR